MASTGSNNKCTPFPLAFQFPCDRKLRKTKSKLEQVQGKDWEKHERAFPPKTNYYVAKLLRSLHPCQTRFDSAPNQLTSLKGSDSICCVFCNESLYSGGKLYELHQKVPGVIRQSKEQEDGVADRIGIRTRIVVHKLCFDDYTKKSVFYLLDYEPRECNPMEPPPEASDLCENRQ